MSDHEIVPRPRLMTRRGREAPPFMIEIQGTLESGQAVRVPLGNRSLKNLRSAIHNYMVRRQIGARVCVTADGPDHIIAWLEPRKPSTRSSRKGKRADS